MPVRFVAAVLAAVMLVSCSPALAVFTSDDSNVVLVPDIANFATFGEDLADMDVTVEFSSGATETAAWVDDAAPGGIASGAFWSIENRNDGGGHTFTSPFKVSNLAGNPEGAITKITFDGFAAFKKGAPIDQAVAFDRDRFDNGGFIGLGTPGSEAGRNLQSFSFAVDVHYSDPVDSLADGPGIFRDLYGTVEINLKERIVPKWSQLPEDQVGENIESDVDWRAVMENGDRQVVADDFISNGRPITGVRWWGSYFNEEDQPARDPNTGGWIPQEEEGFALSFFNIDPTGTGDDPDPGPLAGSYIAPVENVAITDTGMVGWDGHKIWQYEVLLPDTFLDHPSDLARPEAFFEQADEEYWLSIAAESGHRLFVDPETGELVESDTGEDRDARFWGWHTSLESPDDNALFVDNPPRAGGLVMPGEEWIYGPWDVVEYEHAPTGVPAPNMAFELLTTVPESMLGPGEMWRFVQDADNPLNPIPEPSSLLIAAMGLSGAVLLGRRRS